MEGPHEFTVADIRRRSALTGIADPTSTSGADNAALDAMIEHTIAAAKASTTAATNDKDAIDVKDVW